MKKMAALAGSQMALIIFYTIILRIIAECFHDIFTASHTVLCVYYFA